MKFPQQRFIGFPSDVARKYALREVLADTDVFPEGTAECEQYLNDSLERLRLTIAVLPTLPTDARILELGAYPYFLTRLLRRRGLEVVVGNWFGTNSGLGQRASQQVVENGIPHDYVFDHFDAEITPFPFRSSSFDLVLFCQVLEHLLVDPTHALVEIHRVLRPGASLLLTTPNANQLGNLVHAQRGMNVYASLCGEGPHGRHNRQYTIDEIRDLLEGCGYEVIDLFDKDLLYHPRTLRLGPDCSLDGRGDCIFALAQPRPLARWYYPSWLYQSRHAYQRVVRPDLVVGVNCDVQTTGLHALESFGGRPGRWTDGERDATVLLAPPRTGDGILRIKGHGPNIGGSMEIEARVSQSRLLWTLPCDGSEFTLEGAVQIDSTPTTVSLSSDRSWHPSDGDSDDRRVLGFVLQKVSIDPLN